MRNKAHVIMHIVLFGRNTFNLMFHSSQESVDEVQGGIFIDGKVSGRQENLHDPSRTVSSRCTYWLDIVSTAPRMGGLV